VAIAASTMRDAPARIEFTLCVRNGKLSSGSCAGFSCTRSSLRLLDKAVPPAGCHAERALSPTEDFIMRCNRSVLFSTALATAMLVSVSALAQQTASSSSSAMAASADNSGVNQRDRSSQTKTAFDQPNDQADIKLAAAVRRSIVKDKSLSMTAHNVKFIAAQGVVTLRGPVNNADEKAKVEADVKNVAGVNSVDNQLDIKN
jgi:hyperosmotically inducible protein